MSPKTEKPLRVLFVASEAHPLIKTGGLADVAGSLPVALKHLGCDVRLLIPAYRDALTRIRIRPSSVPIDIAGAVAPVVLRQGTLPGTRVETWLVDHAPSFDRPGNPYLDPHGRPWDDNAERFTLFARAAAALAMGTTKAGWQPDIVHCNDWQTGLVPALLSAETRRPATLFTIHNLSYPGLFPYSTFERLGLPAALWSFDKLEFHDRISFIKGGLVFADKLTTVSPTYAGEIQTPEFGCGLDGLLRHRSADLSGILNGIDGKTWNPATDPCISSHYNHRSFANKAHNKHSLQKEFGLPADAGLPVIGLVGRLVQQKGIDQLINILPELMQLPLQLLVLGSGETEYERALLRLASAHPQRLAVRTGYDECVAHRIEAGADIFLMPSRFEPCGLNQMYSLRYGTVPLVRQVGGLADSVIDATPDNLANGTATGIVFHGDDDASLTDAVRRALALYGEKAAWRHLALNGMSCDFSWKTSARHYLDLYHDITRMRA
jgi:starch synthase